MIKIEATKSKLKPLIATVGASIFACAFSVPAFALGTAPAPSHPESRIVSNYSGQYDRAAPLAGVQLADEDDMVQPYGGEAAEHERHEEMEHEGREEMHHMGEEGREHAERLRNRLQEEHAEHERHEMEEHNNPYQAPDEGYGYNGDSD